MFTAVGAGSSAPADEEEKEGLSQPRLGKQGAAEHAGTDRLTRRGGCLVYSLNSRVRCTVTFFCVKNKEYSQLCHTNK